MSPREILLRILDLILKRLPKHRIAARRHCRSTGIRLPLGRPSTRRQVAVDARPCSLLLSPTDLLEKFQANGGWLSVPVPLRRLLHLLHAR